MALRPAQVVVLLADGARPDILQALLHRGALPSIARLFGGSGPPRVDLASSVFPSTTGPAHLPFLTGRYPGPCNVPGIRWFDPHRYSASPLSLFRFRSYMGPGVLLLGRDLAPAVRTIYDTVTDHASAGGNVRRGLRFSRNLTRWSKLAQPVVSFFTERWDRLDSIVGRRVAHAVERGTSFVFGGFYAIDSCGHKFGPSHATTLEAYRRVDAALAPLAETVARLPPAPGPLVLLVSDHGQSDTSQHLDLHALVESIAGVTLAHPLVAHGLFRAKAAVMVSGNAMAHLYLRGRAWGEPQFIDRASPCGSRLLGALLADDAVDQVIGRRTDGAAAVRSRDGEAIVRRSSRGIEYRVVGGRDPFGYPAAFEGIRSDDEWLATTWETNYPDAPVQILQILDSARAGHLVVTSRPRWDLRARFEKPVHLGSHGSLHRDHMMTPMLSTYPLAAGPRRTADVFPTILDALDVAIPPGLDGRSLWHRLT